MKITIEDSNIKIGDNFLINSDGDDLDEAKLLDMFLIIDRKQEIEIDPEINIESDDRKKCELIKLLLDEYINSYYEETEVTDEQNLIAENAKSETLQN